MVESTNPHWSLSSCELSSLGRFGSLRAQVGLGFAVVGLFRRFCPSPPSAFLFPCLFRVCPLRARCVGVGVFSFPRLLRSPSPQNSPLIFIFSSFSSPFHPHFDFTVRTSVAGPASRCVCVCVWNVCTEVKLPFQFHFPGYISQRGDGEDV